MTELSGTIITPSLIYPGQLRFSGQIEATTPHPNPSPSGRGGFILPGFIDLHIHGGGGADCMDGEAAVRQVARFHAGCGTAGFLATTVTAPLADLEAALRGIKAVIDNPQPGEARVLGVHLEGPFINPQKLGAQPPFAIQPSIEIMRHLMSLAPIKVVTLAAELEGALELIGFLSAQGVRVQQGHTIASYDQAQAGFAAGATGFTHFYNAMTGLNHREPGVVGLALEQAQSAEVIPDGLHVHPAAIRTLWKNIPHTYAITDAVAAAGMPEGEYHLGRHSVYRKGNGVFLDSGSLAGSTLTMDKAAQNLKRWGYSWPEVANMTSGFAAQYLGLASGLEVGNPADLVVFNEQLELEAVYLSGQRIK